MKDKNTKRTTFLWIIFILLILNTLVLIGVLFGQLSNLVGYSGSPVLLYIGIALNLIYLVLSIIYLIKLYNVKKDLLKWTNILFGFNMIILIFGLVGTLINLSNILQIEETTKLIVTTSAIIFFGFEVIIVVLIWIFFYRHLKKAKEQRLMQFN